MAHVEFILPKTLRVNNKIFLHDLWENKDGFFKSLKCQSNGLFNVCRTFNKFYKQVIRLYKTECKCMYEWALIFYHLEPKDHVNTYYWINQCSYTKKDMLQC
jgi:hypothetical protein